MRGFEQDEPADGARSEVQAAPDQRSTLVERISAVSGTAPQTPPAASENVFGDGGRSPHGAGRVTAFSGDAATQPSHDRIRHSPGDPLPADDERDTMSQLRTSGVDALTASPPLPSPASSMTPPHRLIDVLGPPTVPSKRRMRRREKVFIALIVLLLLAVGGVGTIAYLNGDRATDWQTRAETLQADVEQLNGIVVRRTDELNRRVLQLNTTGVKLKQTQSALRRSESDVTDLSARQRKLANEKAQLEDQKAALERVSSDMADCTDQLVQLVGWLANEDWYSVQAYVNDVADTCGNAQAGLESYQSTYGY
jgi:DNA-binding transcriptional MerR regulator